MDQGIRMLDCFIGNRPKIAVPCVFAGGVIDAVGYVAGFQRCGRSSPIRSAGWRPSRASTSVR